MLLCSAMCATVCFTTRSTKAGRRMQSRPRRRSEDGLTLIEMIVTIAIITIAVVGITGAVASTERLAAVNQSQANLEVAMRQVADFVRDSSPQGLAYNPCESL